MASADLRDELLCSICLNIFTDPVTLRCRHNFCRVCIDQVLDTQEGSGVYSCPECRAEFQVRPALQRNINLHNVTERFLSTEQHQEEVTGICCTYCIHSPVPAVKSCLHCEASLCDNHLRVHSKSSEHVLTEPSTSLENRKCSVHKKLLEYYCTEDSACICVSCSLAGEHRGHRVEMLNEASEKKKEKLRNILQKLARKRNNAEIKIENLEEHIKKVQKKATGEASRVAALFIDIRRRLDILEKKVLSDISRQEEQMSLSDMIQRLEINKAELSRKMRHIEELCNMTDPLTVLQEPGTGDLWDPEEEQRDEDIWEPDRGDRCVELISKISHSLSDIIRDVNVDFYGQGPADILLDVNTAAKDLRISDNLKMAIYICPPRSGGGFQDSLVISSNTFSSGRHYWDVKMDETELWKVGVCYPSIDRRGDQSYYGCTKSWYLCGDHVAMYEYSVIHDGKEIVLPHMIYSDRVRICIDYEVGQLSFYELSDPIRHIYTFIETFTEPLHATLYVNCGRLKILGV